MKSITHFFINYKMFLPPFPSSCSLSALPIFCYSTFGHVCCTDFWSFTNESYQKNYEKKKKKHQKPLAPLPYISGRKGISQVCVCVCVCTRTHRVRQLLSHFQLLVYVACSPRDSSVLRIL